MTTYKLIFNLNKAKCNTTIYTNDNTPENLKIEEAPDNRLKLNDETMHEFIARILFYSNPSLTVSIKNRLKKLIKLSNIPVKNFIAGISIPYDENIDKILEFDE